MSPVHLLYQQPPSCHYDLIIQNIPKHNGTEIQSVGHVLVAAVRTLSYPGTKVGELVLKVQTHAADAGKDGDLRKLFSAKVAKISSVNVGLEATGHTLNRKDRQNDQNTSELGSARAAISREKAITTNFTVRVCFGYTHLIFTLVASYQDLHSDSLTNV